MLRHEPRLERAEVGVDTLKKNGARFYYGKGTDENCLAKGPTRLT
jgi:hypothetical protein